MTGEYDLVIAGAGIVGCACAWECARRGLRVALLEGAGAGEGATAAGMGHIVVMDDSEAQFALTQYAQRLWRALRPRLPEAVEYHEFGTLWVAADGAEMAEVERKQRYYTERGVEVEVLDGAALGAAEPHLRRGLAGALLVAADAVVYPPAAAAWFAAQAEALGVARIRGAQVTALGGGVARLEDGGDVRGARLVNALGASAAALTAGLPVQGRKGHLVITDRYPGFARHQLVELGYLTSAHTHSADSVAFNVQPRRSGQMLIGSSRQYGAPQGEVEPALLTRMLDRAAAYMPGLDRLSALRAWTGFRAATPDKLPLIGPWPGDASVWIATGHEGLGITTSLATARLLADQLTGAAPEIAIAPYLPARVQIHA